MDSQNIGKSLKPARLIVIMGVSGSGKTTVGAAVGKALEVPFLDADDYHPAANVEKMSHGIPLTDADRWPWLDSLGHALREAADAAGAAVSACSALRRAYRERLIATAGEPILFVLLDGSHETIARRIAARKDHYMPPALLDSQFETLERPEPDENAMVLTVDLPVADRVNTIVAKVQR